MQGRWGGWGEVTPMATAAALLDQRGQLLLIAQRPSRMTKPTARRIAETITNRTKVGGRMTSPYGSPKSLQRLWQRARPSLTRGAKDQPPRR